MNYSKFVILYIKSLLAGILIAISAMAYLLIPNNVIGAFIFSFGLCTIFKLELNLFTGKVGSISKENIKEVLLILLFNFIGVLVMFLLTVPVSSNLFNLTREISTIKLEKSIPSIISDSILCGIIIELLVNLYIKTKNNILTVVGVMLFILSGFEHCIVDMYFFLNAGSLKILYTLPIIILGNGIGAVFIHSLFKKLNYAD